MSTSVGSRGALPFTGFATLPVVVVGLVLSSFGVVLTKLRSKNAG